ncbi:MAG: hypothetical protein QM749_17655 [Aquabacterium sp.]
MQSIIRILKVNDLRSGVGRESGKPYEMQDAECCLLKDTGEVDQVGVLTLPKELTGTLPDGRTKVQPGEYIGTFALRAGMKDRKIGAVLTGLQPYAVGKVSAKSAGAQ